MRGVVLGLNKQQCRKMIYGIACFGFSEVQGEWSCCAEATFVFARHKLELLPGGRRHVVLPRGYIWAHTRAGVRRSVVVIQSKQAWRKEASEVESEGIVRCINVRIRTHVVRCEGSVGVCGAHVLLFHQFLP